jgi:hypothetical protein
MAVSNSNNSSFVQGPYPFLRVKASIEDMVQTRQQQRDDFVVVPIVGYVHVHAFGY